MSPESRLAEILRALEKVGLNALVLGGHAARYYGVHRTTNDFDLHLSPDGWADLPTRLGNSALFAGQAPPSGSSFSSVVAQVRAEAPVPGEQGVAAESEQVEDLLEFRDVQPVRLPFRFFAPDEVREGEESDLSFAVFSHFAAGEEF